MSFIEVYNENIKDLFSEEDMNLDIREDKVKGLKINNLTKILVKNKKQVMTMLRLGS